jgi:hypothetical protein
LLERGMYVREPGRRTEERACERVVCRVVYVARSSRYCSRSWSMEAECWVVVVVVGIVGGIGGGEVVVRLRLRLILEI